MSLNEKMWIFIVFHAFKEIFYRSNYFRSFFLIDKNWSKDDFFYQPNDTCVCHQHTSLPSLNKINNKTSSSFPTVYAKILNNSHFISFSHIIECIYIPIIQHFLRNSSDRKLFHPFNSDKIFNLWEIQLDENKRKYVF